MIDTSTIYKQRNSYHPIIHYIFYSQILINVILVWAHFFTTKQTLFTPIAMTILNFGGVVVERQKYDISIINVYFQAIFQLISNYISFNYFILLTQDFLPWDSFIGITVTIIVFLLMYIPTAIIIWPHISGNISKLLMSFLLLITIIPSFEFVISQTIITKNATANTISNSGFVDAIAFFVLALIIMHNWNFEFPGYKMANKTKPWILIGLMIICIWFLLQNSFGAGKNFFSSFYLFDFSGIHFTVKYVLSGLKAGIAEETAFRYIFLAILLIILDRFRYKIFYSALISSFLFGLIHLTNVSAGQDLPNTLIQVLAAFGIGMLFSSIYLYTGLFIWPVIMHSLIDIFSFSQQGMLMTGKVTTDYIIGMIVIVLFYLLVSFYLLHQTYLREQNSWFY